MAKQDSFCVLPWVLVSAATNGTLYPCCKTIAFNPHGYGSLKDGSLDSMLNQKQFSEIRKKMLQGKPVADCKDCYLIEAAGGTSLRQSSNKEYQKVAKDILKIQSTKRRPTLSWEVRFSNMCNLTCRSCGPESSSAYYREYNKLHGTSYKTLIYPDNKKGSSVFDEISNNLDSIQTLYFAGGEPLLHEKHYELLDLLIRKNRTDMILNYSTNMTNLEYKGKHVLNYWSQFEKIYVRASIDAVGPLASYVRRGSQWDEVEKNLKLVKNMIPNAGLFFSPTVSMYNIFHIKNFINYLIEKKLISHGSYLGFNVLNEPKHLAINLLSETDKMILAAEWKQLEKNLKKNNFPGISYLKKEFKVLEHFMNLPQNKNSLQEFVKITRQYDQIRRENVLDFVPELIGYF